LQFVMVIQWAAKKYMLDHPGLEYPSGLEYPVVPFDNKLVCACDSLTSSFRF
jgi:hypothetical protein